MRQATAVALADLEGWRERQETLEGRMLIQSYCEALQDAALSQRTAALIDGQGLSASAALVEAARLIGRVMGRSEALRERAQALAEVAHWLAGRLSPWRVVLPADGILLAESLPPLALLDRRHPAIIGGGEPALVGAAPLVWGVAGISPAWAGRTAQIDGTSVLIDEAPAAVEEVALMQYETERQAVLETAQRMMRDGLVKLTSGNVSCRIPGTDLFAITPSGMDYETMVADDICIVDLNGRQVQGERRPSSETPMHRLAYLRRPDVDGVVHTHSIYASAFACTGQSMPVISTELAALVGGTIRCAPYAKSGSEEFAEVALQTLGDEDMAVLFQNHGVMAVGRSLKEAYSVAIGLEEAAMIYLLARQMGEPIIIPEAERQRMFRAFRSSYGQPKSDVK